MPFVYRLQKVLNYRIQKKNEQIEVVKLAEREVIRIQNEIDNHKNTIVTLRQNMYSASHLMMESYDIYIKYINDLIDKLEEDKIIAIQRVKEEKEKLVELEKAVKVLEKHKEKAQEEYREEERKAELRRLDEVAGLKHYAKTQEKNKEEELEEARKKGLNINEY